MGADGRVDFVEHRLGADAGEVEFSLEGRKPAGGVRLAEGAPHDAVEEARVAGEGGGEAGEVRVESERHLGHIDFVRGDRVVEGDGLHGVLRGEGVAQAAALRLGEARDHRAEEEVAAGEGRVAVFGEPAGIASGEDGEGVAVELEDGAVDFGGGGAAAELGHGVDGGAADGVEEVLEVSGRGAAGFEALEKFQPGGEGGGVVLGGFAEFG